MKGNDTMYFSQYFKLPVQSHKDLEFVDIDLDNDTKLFLEPGLIMWGHDDMSQRAAYVIDGFFDELYDIYRDQKSDAVKYKLLEHCHEPHATKLGYGNGHNGKARTPEGLIEVFRPLEKVLALDADFDNPLDLPIYLERFAEDCLSDMLTNILSRELNYFTLQQCRKHGIPATFIKKNPRKCFYWDVENHQWAEMCDESLVIEGRRILLVPKRWVRQCLYCNVIHFIRWAIVTRRQKERMVIHAGKEYKPHKKDLWVELKRQYGDMRGIATQYTAEHPDVLKGYHELLPGLYQARWLTDEALDNHVYIN